MVTMRLTARTDGYKFTGKERDAESGLDNFGKRYFGSSLGRFMTPDPLLNSGHPANPQSWNRYAYVLNNPLSNIDPTGLECVWDDGSYDSADDPQTGSKTKCDDAGGTWVDHLYFQQNGLGDWSGDPNSVIASDAQARPCSEQDKEAMNHFNEGLNRVVAGLIAPAKVAFGAVKVLTGVVGEAASPETGVLAPITAVASTRFMINSGGQVVSGLTSAYYALTGNQSAETVSNMAIAGTTESGL
jgi:RHS repeat-associated protein